jgi:hypothetical protein
VLGDDRPYTEVIHDQTIAAHYRRNATALGRVFHDGPVEPFAATDLGNVSFRIPCIHPTIRVDAAGYSNHQPQFAAACASRSGDAAVIDGSMAMAFTIIDVAQDPELRQRLLS